MERTKNSAILIIHNIFRPRQSEKSLERYDPLSLLKLAGEGQLVERNNFLGWDIQNLSLCIFLSQDKDTAWVHDIRASLDLTKINTDKLEYPIGDLNHAAHIITPAR